MKNSQPMNCDAYYFFTIHGLKKTAAYREKARMHPRGIVPWMCKEDKDHKRGHLKYQFNRRRGGDTNDKSEPGLAKGNNDHL